MFVRLFAFLFLMCASCDVAVAISGDVVPRPGAVPVDTDRGQPIYKASDVIPIDIQDLRPDVSGGTKSVEGEFPTMGMLSNCSANLLGPKVIFTASHCQNTGTRITFKHRGSGKSFPGVCTRHPQYNDRTVFNDYTLCVLDEKVPEGTLFASFNTSGSPTRGDKLIINGGGMPNFGVHYHGEGVVNSISGQDIVTCGPNQLTSGDSGGSALRFITDFRKGPFVVEGVNSRAGGGCSYFNSTSSPEFKSWASAFATEKNVEICGINKDCTNPLNPTRCVDENLVVSYLEKVLLGAKSRLAMCERSK